MSANNSFERLPTNSWQEAPIRSTHICRISAGSSYNGWAICVVCLPDSQRTLDGNF